jgi:hypothetical protein
MATANPVCGQPLLTGAAPKALRRSTGRRTSGNSERSKGRSPLPLASEMIRGNGSLIAGGDACHLALRSNSASKRRKRRAVAIGSLFDFRWEIPLFRKSRLETIVAK